MLLYHSDLCLQHYVVGHFSAYIQVHDVWPVSTIGPLRAISTL